MEKTHNLINVLKDKGEQALILPNVEKAFAIYGRREKKA